MAAHLALFIEHPLLHSHRQPPQQLADGSRRLHVKVTPAVGKGAERPRDVDADAQEAFRVRLAVPWVRGARAALTQVMGGRPSAMQRHDTPAFPEAKIFPLRVPK